MEQKGPLLEKEKCWKKDLPLIRYVPGNLKISVYAVFMMLIPCNWPHLVGKDLILLYPSQTSLGKPEELGIFVSACHEY